MNNQFSPDHISSSEDVAILHATVVSIKYQSKAEIMKRGREKKLSSEVSNSALEVNLATDESKHNLAGL